MACFFIDIDQTFAWDGTYVPHKGAVEQVTRFLESGNQVFFITGRNDYKGLRGMLNFYGLSGAGLITSLQWPRVVICDREPKALNHPPDTNWGSRYRHLEKV